MAGTKMSICTNLTMNLPKINGSGQEWRMSIGQKICSGPSGVLDRHVTLILNPEEAINLAHDILSRLPALSVSVEQVNKIQKLLNCQKEPQG